MEYKLKKLSALGLMAIILLLSASGNAIAEKTYNKVILISWDGSQSNHTNKLYDTNKLPNLMDLRKNGGLNILTYNGSGSQINIVDHLTDTDSGHAQMLTGYGPDVTTIAKNSYNSIPDGLTIFERLPSSYSVGLISSRESAQGFQAIGHGFPTVTFKNASTEIDYWWDASKISWGSQGILYEAQQHDITQYVQQVTADNTSDQVINWLDINKDNNFFLFVHFGEPDFSGHLFGENSDEYNNGIIDADNATGRIVKKLKDLKIYDKTSIIVTTDHGFTENGFNHTSLPYPVELSQYANLADPDCYKIWMVSNTIKGDRIGYQNDLAPTIYGLFGIDYNSFKPSFNTSILGKYQAKPIWERPLKVK